MYSPRAFILSGRHTFRFRLEENELSSVITNSSIRMYSLRPFSFIIIIILFFSFFFGGEGASPIENEVIFRNLRHFGKLQFIADLNIQCPDLLLIFFPFFLDTRLLTGPTASGFTLLTNNQLLQKSRKKATLKRSSKPLVSTRMRHWVFGATRPTTSASLTNQARSLGQSPHTWPSCCPWQPSLPWLLCLERYGPGVRFLFNYLCANESQNLNRISKWVNLKFITSFIEIQRSNNYQWKKKPNIFSPTRYEIQPLTSTFWFRRRNLVQLPYWDFPLNYLLFSSSLVVGIISCHVLQWLRCYKINVECFRLPLWVK